MSAVLGLQGMRGVDTALAMPADRGGRTKASQSSLLVDARSRATSNFADSH